MGKYEKLLKNSGIFLVGNLGSKLLTFLLVRFYTEVLTADEYGTADLILTTVNLVIPIFTLCIVEAVLRFSIDDIEKRKDIFSFGIFVAVIGSAVLLLALPVFGMVEALHGNILMLYLLTVANALYVISAHFTRGIGNSKIFASSGVVNTFVQIVLNIIFLVTFSWGLKGYLLASVLSSVIATVYLFLYAKLYKYLTISKDWSLLKQMFVYSCPLIPNSILWWLMQSSGRYIISFILGSAANGLYSVANKIPTIITSISNIFLQAWQLSSVDEAKSADKGEFYSNIFEKMSMLLICVTSFICVILQSLFGILVEESYYSGWQCVPFLMDAMVFSCFSGFLTSNYIAMKKTNGVFLTTVLGAIANLLLSIVLTPTIGIIGTALAVFVALAITWIIRAYDTRNFVKITYKFKTFVLPLIIMIMQSAFLSVGIVSVWIQAVCFAVIVTLYFADLINMAKIAWICVKKMVFRKS